LPDCHGSYKYDEEGVVGQRVCLVENGILRNFMHSRESAGKLGKSLGISVVSNGHARSSGYPAPVPRMSNLVVRSANEHSMDELKEMLFLECRKRRKPYGLMITGLPSGFVDFGGSYFHTQPQKIYRLYVDGRIERVKGLYLVSTPYTLLDNIVATSCNYAVNNGYCGAESGLVPGTETAPDAFIKSVEFGLIPRSEYETYYPFLSPQPKLNDKGGN